MRTWVNWKKIMTFFVLISSPIPCESELAEYRVRLTDNGENQFINKAQFIMVSIIIILTFNRPNLGSTTTRANLILLSKPNGLQRKKLPRQRLKAVMKNK